MVIRSRAMWVLPIAVALVTGRPGGAVETRQGPIVVGAAVSVAAEIDAMCAKAYPADKPGGARSQLLPAGRDRFFIRDSFTRIHFGKNAAGQATTLSVDDWGAVEECVRDDKASEPTPVVK